MWEWIVLGAFLIKSSQATVCWAEGGTLEAGTSKACVIPFYYERHVQVNGVDVIYGQAFQTCAPMEQTSAPVEAQFLSNGSLNVSNLILPEQASIDFWCPTAGLYSSISAEYQPKWGFCTCETPIPTQSPTTPTNVNQTSCVQDTECATGEVCADFFCSASPPSVAQVLVPLHETALEENFSLDLLQQHLLREILNTSGGLVAFQDLSVNIDLVNFSPSCHTDGGWAGQASSCAFPFTIGDQTFHTCQRVEDIQPYLGNETNKPPGMPLWLREVYWCPTIPEYNAMDSSREMWGFCDCGATWPVVQTTFQPLSTSTGGTGVDCQQERIKYNNTVHALTLLRESLDSTRASVDLTSGDSTLQHSAGYYFRLSVRAARTAVSGGRESILSALQHVIARSMEHPLPEISVDCTIQAGGKPIEEESTSSPTESPSAFNSHETTNQPTDAPVVATSTKSPTSSPVVKPTRSPVVEPTSESVKQKQAQVLFEEQVPQSFVAHPACNAAIVAQAASSFSQEILVGCHGSTKTSCVCIRELFRVMTRVGVLCMGRIQQVVQDQHSRDCLTSK